jgi:hypothetical protein
VVAELRGGEHDAAARAANLQRIAVLERIRPDLAPWRKADLRRQPRLAIDVEALMCVGLGPIAGGLAGPATGATAAPSRITSASVVRDGDHPFRTGSLRADDPSPAEAAAGVPGPVVEEIEIRPFAVQPTAELPACAPSAVSEPPPHAVLADSGWRVTDRSLDGLRLVGHGAAGAGLGVGALVAVRPADADQWVLGVVRRVRKSDSDAIELGVALLAERALPVTLHARRPASGDLAFDVDGVAATDVIGRFAGLYLIPPAPPEARPSLRTVIIPSSEHFEGRNLFLATARSNYAVTLRHLVDHHTDWSRVAIQVTARS